MISILTVILLAGGDPAGLPLEDPLNWWIFALEPGSGEMLPGTMPSGETGVMLTHILSSGRLSGLGDFLLHRTSPPGSGDAEGMVFAVEGTVAGEILSTDGEFQSRGGLTGRIHADIVPGLFIDERISLWTGSDEQPPDYFSPYHLGQEEGRHLYVDWGYISWSPDPLNLSFGRIPQRWGPGRFTSLLISGNSPSLDMIRLNFTLWDIVDFTGMTATIDSDSGTYLTAHRLDIRAARNLRIGLSESILFKAEGLDLAYMNPVVPWYPIQWNERDDDNAFFSFDCSWKPFRDAELYGELLIDDIQYENTADRPNKLGWTAGMSAFLTPLETALQLEYTRIDRYVYSQRRPCNYYLHDGRIIGSGLGPDADRVTFSAGTAALWPLLAEATLTHSRHGEGTVEEGWPDSASTGGSFPSGIVEHSTSAGIHLGWYPIRSLEVHASLENTWIENLDHVTGSEDDILDTALEVIWTW